MTTPIHNRWKLDEDATERMTFLTPCILCGGTSEFDVSKQNFFAWKSGMLIQTVWPDVPKEVREAIISGSHATCFDIIVDELPTPWQDAQEVNDREVEMN